MVQKRNCDLIICMFLADLSTHNRYTLSAMFCVLKIKMMSGKMLSRQFRNINDDFRKQIQEENKKNKTWGLYLQSNSPGVKTITII